MTKDELDKLIAGGETLTVEFKSDVKRLSDRDLVEAVVALANTEGGWLLLGVEDGTGEITGLHSSHRGGGTPVAVIANLTQPPLAVEVKTVECGSDVEVFAIWVPEVRGVVGTTGGYYAKRRLKADGTPEAVPMSPFELQSRVSRFQLIDPSAQPIEAVPLSKINALQRERMRESIRRSNTADKALLTLPDQEFDRALELVKECDGKAYLTLAGVLFLTDEITIRNAVPAYEVAFQVLKGADVVVNEYSRKPLVELYDNVIERFKARIEETEVIVGARRRAAPNYDLDGFREALTNALVHRDYAILGSVVVKLDEHGLSVFSPGGFVEGVTLQNLLSTAPRSRNVLLADIAKRIGLAERTGRGVDKIYAGVLRYGRHSPNYDRSDSAGVTLTIAAEPANFNFLNFVLEEEGKLHRTLTVDELLIFAYAYEMHVLTFEQIVKVTQRKPNIVQVTIAEMLARNELVQVEFNGEKKYLLPPAIVNQISGSAAPRMDKFVYETVRTMVLKFLQQNESINRGTLVDDFGLNVRTATYILGKMLEDGDIVKEGERRWTVYRLPTRNV